MAVFITAITDPFEELRDEARTRQPQINIRRPLRGIQVKEDTYAVLRVMQANGDELPIFDSSSPDVDADGIGHSSHYANFIIQGYQDQRAEKQQIIQTFGEDYIFFFGEQPRFINVNGILFNTKDFNWKNEFLENYERYLRGTRLVEQNARLYLYFDDVVIEGYLVSSSIQQMADAPYHVSFSFQMFVCQYATLSNVGSVYFQENFQSVLTTEGRISDADVFRRGGATSEGLGPDTPAAQSAAAQNATTMGSSGGLNGFLASAGKFFNDASLSVNRTLEVIRNTFYGRQIVVPQGIGSALKSVPLQNLATFESAPLNQPIHTMLDEYVARTPDSTHASFDEAELNRINEQLRLQTPEELERQARASLEALGIDTTRRETGVMLLGRGAFAAAQYVGTFGARQADGTLNVGGLAANVVNI